LASNSDAGDVQGPIRSRTPGPAVPALGEDAKARNRSPKQKRSTVRGPTHGDTPVSPSRCAKRCGAHPAMVSTPEWTGSTDTRAPQLRLIVAEGRAICEPVDHFNWVKVACNHAAKFLPCEMMRFSSPPLSLSAGSVNNHRERAHR